MPKLWNKNYWKVMTANFMLFFSFYLLMPLLPIYLDAQFGADKDTIGLVLSGYTIAALAVRPFSGYLVDAFDRKRVLTLCFLIFFVCFTGYIGASTILAFALIRTIHGIPFGASTVANSTMAIDVLPSERRNEGMGYYGLSNNLAMAIAPTAAIWLYSRTDKFQLLFWIALVIALFGFICVTSVEHPKREAAARRPKMSLDRFFLGRAWLMAINITLFALCWGLMSNYVAIYGKEQLGMTDNTGLFFVLLSAGLVTSRLYGAKMLRQGRLVHAAIEGALISAVGYTLFALVEAPWAFFMSALMIGLGNGRMYPAFLNMFISVARHDQRGTANSSILTAWDLGMGIGILAGGVALEYCGYSFAFRITAISQIAGAALLIFATRRFFESRRLE